VLGSLIYFGHERDETKIIIKSAQLQMKIETCFGKALKESFPFFLDAV
jgi:hypothetical protein